MSDPNKPEQDIFARKITLETDLVSLSGLRDQLALALLTLEQNTDRVVGWLRDNRESIIIARRQLQRALIGNKAQEVDVLKTVKAIDADVLGFVLDSPDFKTLAENSYGFATDGPVNTYLSGLQLGLPARLLESLPDIVVPDSVGETLAKTTIADQPAAPADETPKPKSGGGIGDWFKSRAQRDAEEAETAYRGMIDHWRKMQRDLIGLQSDRHYYIDSFMDWVGENLSPTDPQQDFAAILRRYQHPAFMLQRAQEDFDEAQRLRAEKIRDEAETYSALAGLLDAQDIKGFIARLPDLFPYPDTASAQDLRRLLLRDFGCESIADIAMLRVRKPDDVADLFDAACRYEKELRLDGHQYNSYAFDKVLTRVVISQNLPARMLTTALRKFALKPAEAARLLTTTKALPQIAERLGDDDLAQFEALSAVLRGVNAGADIEAVSIYVSLRRAALEKDAPALAAALSRINGEEQGARVRNLWDLCLDNRDFIRDLRDAANGEMKTMMPLLASTISTGMAQELSIPAQGDRALHKIFWLVEDHVLPQAAQTNSGALRLLLASSLLAQSPEMTAQWRQRLVGPKGYIAAMMRREDMLPDARLSFVSALLAPLRDLRDRTAVLSSVAAEVPEPALRDSLNDAALALTGDTMPLDSRSFLINPTLIANMWYGGNANLMFTINGTSHVLERSISAEAAHALMDVIAARHGFLREKDGIFQPQLADIFEYAADGKVSIGWGHDKAPLNIDAATAKTLKSLPGFVHATLTDEQGRPAEASYNLRSVMALLPAGEQWLMIDRNGGHQVLNDITLPKDMPGFVKVGGAYVQPACASFITANEDTRSLDLRIEARAFLPLLQAMKRQPPLDAFVGDTQYLRLTAFDDRQWWQAIDELKRLSPTLLCPGGEFAHLYFNLQVLGFVTAYASKQDQMGLRFSTMGRTGVQGRVEVEADIDRLQRLMQGLIDAAGEPATLTIYPEDQKDAVPVIIDTAQIQDFFYNAGDSKLTVLSAHENLNFKVTDRQAQALIKTLRAVPGFEEIDSRGRGVDLLRLDRTTRIAVDRREKAVTALVDNREVPLGLTESDFARYRDQLVRQGKLQEPKSLPPRVLADFASACDLPLTAPAHFPVPRKTQQPEALLERVIGDMTARRDDFNETAYRNAKSALQRQDAKKKTSAPKPKR